MGNRNRNSNVGDPNSDDDQFYTLLKSEPNKWAELDDVAIQIHLNYYPGKLPEQIGTAMKLARELLSIRYSNSWLFSRVKKAPNKVEMDKWKQMLVDVSNGQKFDQYVHYLRTFRMVVTQDNL